MAEKKSETKIGKRTLSLSNLDKKLFPKTGVTKGDVIKYYTEVSSFLLPHLKDRPITMKRFPDGIKGEFFYEKNAPSFTPSWIKTKKVTRSSGGAINYIIINSIEDLIWTVNLANIEMHTLLSRAQNLSKPSFMVFDLDPGLDTNVLTCAEVAFKIKDLLDVMKLESFVKVSGSKGLQLYVPLNTASTFKITGEFSKNIALALQASNPNLIVSKMSKDLRKGKVFIDWSQNSETKTTVCVYSMRAKNDVPYISMPVSWKELEAALKKENPDRLYFEPEEAIKLLRKNGDLFDPVLKLKQKITGKMLEALQEVSQLSGKEIEQVDKKQIETKKAEKSILKEYKKKRNFNATPEPAAKVKKSKGERKFVIQKHQASHLHYDFRLEMQGVLRSWAVPKGPPLKAGERRLAMHVEDHPIDYAGFEGIIPPGNYGAGTVMVWDQGTYDTESHKPTAEYYNGKLILDLQGEKLNGRWVLVKDSRDDKRWYLMMDKGTKVKIPKTRLDRSVISKRTLDQISKAADKEWQSNRKK
jgi:bifunctional non-homologous end joining protein LigD